MAMVGGVIPVMRRFGPYRAPEESAGTVVLIVPGNEEAGTAALLAAALTEEAAAGLGEVQPLTIALPGRRTCATRPGGTAEQGQPRSA